MAHIYLGCCSSRPDIDSLRPHVRRRSEPCHAKLGGAYEGRLVHALLRVGPLHSDAEKPAGRKNLRGKEEESQARAVV